MPYNLTYRASASFTVSCSAGEGQSVTAYATESSIISQRDADRKARELAKGLAQSRLECLFPLPPSEVRYYNEAQSVTDTCYAGTADPSGDFNPAKEFTVTWPAGAVYSLTSVEDANAAALKSAEAELALVLFRTCETYYQNVEKSFTASCTPPKTGDDNTATVAAGAFTNFISQETVDDLAEAAAQAEAIEGLDCVQVFYNTTQIATVDCEDGLVGPPSSATVYSGTYSSEVSQEAANALAYAAAEAAATAALSCTSGYANTEQSATVNCEDVYGPCSFGSSSSAVIAAGTYFSEVSQEAADAAALAAAQAAAEAGLSCYINPNCVP